MNTNPNRWGFRPATVKPINQPNSNNNAPTNPPQSLVPSRRPLKDIVPLGQGRKKVASEVGSSRKQVMLALPKFAQETSEPARDEQNLGSSESNESNVEHSSENTIQTVSFEEDLKNLSGQIGTSNIDLQSQATADTAAKQYDKDLEDLLAQVRPSDADLGTQSTGDMPEKQLSEATKWNPVTNSTRTANKNYVLTREYKKKLETKNDPKRAKFATTKKQERIEKKPMFAVANSKKEKLAFAREILPAGVIVDNDGNISGTLQITHTPAQYRQGATVLDGNLGVSYADRFSQLGSLYMQKSTRIDDLEITFQAGLGDLARLNDLEILDSGSSFLSKEIDESRMIDLQKGRTKVIAHAIHDFAGSDEALFVLSSIIQPSIVQKLQGSLSNGKGVASNSHLGPFQKAESFTVLKDNGSREKLSWTNFGVSSAKLKLSRDNGDFLLTVDWPTYYTRPLDRSRNVVEGMPLGPSDGIGVHFYAEIRINEAAAHERKLVLATDGIQATFKGRFDLNQE